MRLSVDPKDPGYHPEAFTATVYLDGEKVKKAITADEELGQCLCLVEPLEKMPDGSPKTHILYGTVSIKWKHEPRIS